MELPTAAGEAGEPGISALADPSGAPIHAPDARVFQDRALGRSGELTEFADAVALLQHGECLLEYGRANGTWERVVRGFGSARPGQPAPFAVEHRTSKEQVLYRATCQASAADRERAMDAISWAPGRGALGAGRGWRADGAGPSWGGAFEEGIAAWDLPGDYDWCVVGILDGDIVVIFYCGYNDGPCPAGELYDAYTDQCLDPDTLPGGGSGPGDPPDPEPCDPNEHICPDPELVVECDLESLERGQEITCTASVTENGSMSDLAWTYQFAGGTLTNLASTAELSGPMAVTGTLQATASINDGPSDSASVTVTVLPRTSGWPTVGTYQVQPDTTSGSALPVEPKHPKHLGDSQGNVDLDGDFTPYTTLIEAGPNEGIRYFTSLPTLDLVNNIRINRTALTSGSAFMNLQADCTLGYLVSEVEKHEGMAPVQAQSHTKYFENEFNAVFPGLLESVAGTGNPSPVEAILQARNTARQHSATLDNPGVSLTCDLQLFPPN